MRTITSHQSCSRARRHIHAIFPSEPHPQSLASLLLIKDIYTMLDPETNPYSKWIIFKNNKKQILKEHFATYGKYICTYCKRDDLSIAVKQSDPRRATIDHIIPTSRGGSLTNMNNMTVCCSKCNSIKGNSILEFLPQF